MYFDPQKSLYRGSPQSLNVGFKLWSRSTVAFSVAKLCTTNILKSLTAKDTAKTLNKCRGTLMEFDAAALRWRKKMHLEKTQETDETEESNNTNKN